MGNKIRIDIAPNQVFINEDGTFDKKSAINLSGKIAGVCYDKEGFDHLENEPEEKTNRRINMTLNNGHHSVYDHNQISFNLQNVPKILAMALNNEHQYTTSEKSARYTPVVRESDDSYISELEAELYKKWMGIFRAKITAAYGNIFNETKIEKLAQENARYLVTVFMPTQMVYTTSLRQINYIASWMAEYSRNAQGDFEEKLAEAMTCFISELDRNNVLEEGLLKNEKDRKLSIFAPKGDIEKREEYFGFVYSTSYFGSFAQYAQAHRHRTLNYQLEMSDKNPCFYIPPIIKDDNILINEWLRDMNSVRQQHPQGELVRIHECGTYDNFILKCKERLCSAAQLEIMQQTKETLTKYHQALKESGSYLADDIEKYTHGARCTFPDFKCTSDCKFAEGKLLTRKI